VATSLQFSGPKLVHDVDVARYARACPAGSVTQGVYFQYLRSAVEAECGKDERLYAGLSRRDWTAFRRYSLRDFMCLAVNAAQLAHPKEALSEGLRRLGRLAYPSLAATMAGRVVLYAFGERLENVVKALPKAYAISVPGTVVETYELGPTHYRITMKNVYNFVDTYHLGVLEGAVLAMGFQPRITVTVGERLCDAEFQGGWEE
jgi:uncharacterized protein (TIGR02265 family)